MDARSRASQDAKAEIDGIQSHGGDAILLHQSKSIKQYNVIHQASASAITSSN